MSPIRSLLYTAIAASPHQISHAKVVFEFDPTKPGSGAMNQLLNNIEHSIAGADRYACLSDIAVRCMLLNARRLARKTRRPWWTLAHELFAVGSNSSIALCQRAGLDPDAMANEWVAL